MQLYSTAIFGFYDTFITIVLFTLFLEKLLLTCAITKVESKKDKRVIPPGIEPGTLSVLDSCDNRYTMESRAAVSSPSLVYKLSAQMYTHSPISST